MTKLTIIGAGSTVFTKNIVVDLLTIEEFKSMGVEIFAVSTDSHFCHKAWYDSSETIAKIQYTMLSDNTFEISRNFQILRENLKRATSNYCDY